MAEPNYLREQAREIVDSISAYHLNDYSVRLELVARIESALKAERKRVATDFNRAEGEGLER